MNHKKTKRNEMKSRRCVLNAVRLALIAIGALLLSPLLVVGGALCLVGVAQSHGAIGPRGGAR